MLAEEVLKYMQDIKKQLQQKLFPDKKYNFCQLYTPSINNDFDDNFKLDENTYSYIHEDSNIIRRLSSVRTPQNMMSDWDSF